MCKHVAAAGLSLGPVTHNGQTAGDGDVDGGRGWGGGGVKCWREELGRMNLIKKWRLFKGISDSDQAAVSPQAEAG